MFGRLAEMVVDGEPLRSAPQTGILDDRSKILMIERQGFHRLSGSPARTYIKTAAAGRALVADAAEPGRNSFKALAFLFLGRLTAVSTTC